MNGRTITSDSVQVPVGQIGRPTPPKTAIVDVKPFQPGKVVVVF